MRHRASRESGRGQRPPNMVSESSLAPSRHGRQSSQVARICGRDAQWARRTCIGKALEACRRSTLSPSLVLALPCDLVLNPLDKEGAMQLAITYRAVTDLKP